ncbi:MAG: DUF4129 domain-containing protein [Pseudomonadota bacterium]
MRVWARIGLIWVGMCVCLALSASAQVRVEEGLEATASGEAYQKSLRFRGIDTDVAYFDPTRPPPELDTRQTPDPDRRDIDVDISRDQATFLENSIMVAILLAIAFMFLRFGGGFTVSLRGDSDAQRPSDGARPGDVDFDTIPSDIDAIARIPDRNLALVTLAQSALIQAVMQQGLLLQKSWTARDALRRLPRDMDHRDALRDLVAAGERVLFGGREVREEDFQDMLTRIRPIFGGATS